MSDKNFNNFYHVDKKTEMPENCPNCLYSNKKVEKMPKDCPECFYTSPKKEILNPENDEKGNRK